MWNDGLCVDIFLCVDDGLCVDGVFLVCTFAPLHLRSCRCVLAYFRYFL